MWIIKSWEKRSKVIAVRVCRWKILYVDLSKTGGRRGVRVNSYDSNRQTYRMDGISLPGRQKQLEMERTVAPAEKLGFQGIDVKDGGTKPTCKPRL